MKNAMCGRVNINFARDDKATLLLLEKCLEIASRGIKNVKRCLLLEHTMPIVGSSIQKCCPHPTELNVLRTAARTKLDA